MITADALAMQPPSAKMVISAYAHGPTSMATAELSNALGVMSAPQFRSFQMTRPDHERWELVKGVPVMMVPPTIIYNRIAGNLERLLNDALAKHNPTRFAVQG